MSSAPSSDLPPNLPPDDQRWNTNIHYTGAVIAGLPTHVRTVLDVGCGEGLAVRALTASGRSAVGIDPHAPSIEAARAQDPRGRYLCADALVHDFGDERFDAVISITALHHMDVRAALTRMSEVLKPGGMLEIVSIARADSRRAELWRGVVGAWVLRTGLGRLGKPKEWLHPSPIVWPAPHTLNEVRAIAAEVLPGARIAWLPLFRYELRWTKPA